MILGVLTNIKKIATGEWRYKGITNRLMDKHTWTDGTETVDVYWMDGAAEHAGWVVKVESPRRDATLQLNNGFVSSLWGALVLADLHMRDDGQAPAAFMHSDRIESDKGPGNAVRQDEWLAAHAHDYEFRVIDPNEVNGNGAR